MSQWLDVMKARRKALWSCCSALLMHEALTRAGVRTPVHPLPLCPAKFAPQSHEIDILMTTLNKKQWLKHLGRTEEYNSFESTQHGAGVNAAVATMTAVALCALSPLSPWFQYSSNNKCTITQ